MFCKGLIVSIQGYSRAMTEEMIVEIANAGAVAIRTDKKVNSRLPLIGLIKNKALYTCGKIGNFLAASSIKAEGARKGLPKYSEIDKLIIRNIFWTKSH